MLSSGFALSDWFFIESSNQVSDDSCEIRSSISSTERDEEACSSLIENNNDNSSNQQSRSTSDEDATVVSYRSIGPQDRNEIQQLHEEWFPVLYHDEFYDDLAAGRDGHYGEPLYSCLVVKNRQCGADDSMSYPTDDATGGRLQSAQVMEDEIIASVIGTFVPASSLSETMRELLLSDERFTKLFYLMTLGCRDEYRKEGWATDLVKHSLQHAMQDGQCGAVYLHVITYNFAAIRLYERLGFYRVKEIVNYYTIDGKKYNCFLYAKYLNGNRGHLGLLHLLSNAFVSLWKHFITVPVNIWIDATGVNNNSRLIDGI